MPTTLSRREANCLRPQPLTRKASPKVIRGCLRSLMITDTPHPRLRLLHYLDIVLIVLAAPAVLFAQASKITSSEGGYSVIFPVPAARQTDPPKTENGVTYSSEMYSATLEGQMFLTVYTRYEGTTSTRKKNCRLMWTIS